jgi:hypothetical protein
MARLVRATHEHRRKQEGRGHEAAPCFDSTPSMGSLNELGHVGVREALYRSLKID